MLGKKKVPNEKLRDMKKVVKIKIFSIPSFLPLWSLSFGIQRLSLDIESSCTSSVMDEDIMRKLREGVEGFTACV